MFLKNNKSKDTKMPKYHLNSYMNKPILYIYDGEYTSLIQILMGT